MKKIALTIISCMLVIILGGCSSQGAPIHEVGTFTVEVPDGWLVVPMNKLGSDDVILDDVVSLYKGATDPTTAAFSFPGVIISVNPIEKPFDDTRGYYDDATDVKPIILDDVTWNGFVTNNSGYPIVNLTATTDEGIYNVIIANERSEGSISINDNDVQEILKSIKITK